MTNLPNTSQKSPFRDKKGRFIKSGASQNDTLPPVPTFESTPSGPTKESQPNFEDVYLQEAERTKELKEELAELEKQAEVKEIKGEVELPEMVKKEGVEVVGEETPIPSQPTVVLPLDDTKVYKIVKNFKKLHQNVKDSVTWLAFWCYRQLQLLGIKLKEVGGQVIRQKS